MDTPHLNLSQNWTSIPAHLFWWLTISKFLWWYVLICSFISFFLYAYTSVTLFRGRKVRRGRILMAICISDGLMLLIMGVNTLIQEYAPHNPTMGHVLCKLTTFASNVSSFFTNWCWLLIWGERYLAVVHPIWHFRKTGLKLDRLIVVLLVVVLISEGWSLVGMIELSEGGLTFCSIDDQIFPLDIMKWYTLAEALLSYIIPFFLILAANISLFCVTYAKADTLHRVTRAELNGLSTTQRESATVVSNQYWKNKSAKRNRALRRTILAATVDTILNCPLIIINLVHNFYSFPLEVEVTMKFVEAFAFVLFYIQYPMFEWYVQLLAKEINTSSMRMTQTLSSPTTRSQKSPNLTVDREVLIHRPASPFKNQKPFTDTSSPDKMRRCVTFGRVEDLKCRAKTLLTECGSEPNLVSENPICDL